MIENNVITKGNLQVFQDNPLMSEPVEAKKDNEPASKNVGMLLDVAHLKVSANTLGFKKTDMFYKLKRRIYGYHLSENN